MVQPARSEDGDDWLDPESAFPWAGYIERDIEILRGKPIVKGTRLSVEFVLDLFALGWSEQQVLDNYPRLTSEAIRAVFAFAAEQIRQDARSRPILAAR
jgi:uncharacterized protein (DUF433 family)